MWKYVWIFLAYSIGLGLLLGLIETIFDLDTGGGVSLVIPAISAMAARDKFIADTLRVPTKDEKWWLVWRSFAVSIAWSLASTAVFAAIGWLDWAGEISTGLWIGIAVFALVFSFLFILGGYTFWAKKSLENQIRARERKAAKAAARS